MKLAMGLFMVVLSSVGFGSDLEYPVEDIDAQICDFLVTKLGVEVEKTDELLLKKSLRVSIKPRDELKVLAAGMYVNFVNNNGVEEEFYATSHEENSEYGYSTSFVLWQMDPLTDDGYKNKVETIAFFIDYMKEGTIYRAWKSDNGRNFEFKALTNGMKPRLAEKSIVSYTLSEDQPLMAAKKTCE